MGATIDSLTRDFSWAVTGALQEHAAARSGVSCPASMLKNAPSARQAFPGSVLRLRDGSIQVVDFTGRSALRRLRVSGFGEACHAGRPVALDPLRSDAARRGLAYTPSVHTQPDHASSYHCLHMLPRLALPPTMLSAASLAVKVPFDCGLLSETCAAPGLTMISINLLSSVAIAPKAQGLNFLERICNSVDGPADRVSDHLRHYTNLSSVPLILQFGVMGGRTLRTISKVAAAQLPKTKLASIWGFDSFTGLPDEATGNYAAADWKRGAFSATVRTNDLSRQQSRIQSVITRIKARTIGDVHLIPGFYDQSLTQDLGKLISRIGPATYIDVDCDLYVSSFQALDWAFANGLVGVGTMIGYDDWWVLPCATPKSQGIEHFGGEARAHFEIARKYRVTFECFCGPCAPTVNFTKGWRTYFIVRGLSAADAGFSMDAAAVQSFLATNGGCVHHKKRRRAHFA